MGLKKIKFKVTVNVKKSNESNESNYSNRTMRRFRHALMAAQP